MDPDLNWTPVLFRETSPRVRDGNNNVPKRQLAY
jgi:hypothetical protein